MEKLLIIDGNSLAYRAFYAMPFLSSPDGTNTGAIFGFMNMFIKAIEDNSPNYVAVAFDFSKHTFRTKLFDEYKGTRKETPPELRSQFPLLKNLLKKMNVKVFEQEGVEADDIIGTISKKTNLETYILSGDKDLLQLINDKTSVLLTRKGITDTQKFTPETLKREMNLLPSQIIDLKSLKGDASDNIPGVKGVGDKSAKMLIEKFGTLENIYKNIESPEISKSLKAKLLEHRAMAELSYKLATIKIDCDIDFKLEDCKLDFPFNSSVKELFRKYNFPSLLRKNIFQTEDKLKVEESEIEEFELSSLDQLNNFKPENMFAFNFITKLEFAGSKKISYKLKEKYDLFSVNIDLKDVLLKLKSIFEDEGIFKITNDLKSHLHLFEKFGINLKGKVFDLKLGAYLIGGSTNITAKAGEYFELYEDISGKIKELDLENLYQQIELPLVYVLFEMEKDGFKLDTTELENLSNIYQKELGELENQIQHLAGESFNVRSPKQVFHILFDKLKLAEAGKKQSTNIEVLNELASLHPIVPLLIRHRKLQKLNSTYIEPYREIVKCGDIIHTIFNQTLTATGRLSSSEPNLQNIPVRDEQGKLLRKLFISRFQNGKIMSADYNQIELRLLAHYSEDEVLISAYKDGKDIHTLTASQIFGVPIEEVSSSQRRNAKAVNFGIIYGISDFGLAQNVNISVKEAKAYIDKYFENYPSVKRFMQSNVEFAKQNGFIRTMLNRIRKIPELNSPMYQTRQFGERIAMNMPLQGSASDIIKIAMIKVQKALKDSSLQSRLVLQIHDELIVDVMAGEEEKVKQILKDCMENVVSLKVPLPVEISSGRTWFDCK